MLLVVFNCQKLILSSTLWCHIWKCLTDAYKKNLFIYKLNNEKYTYNTCIASKADLILDILGRVSEDVFGFDGKQI